MFEFKIHARQKSTFARTGIFYTSPGELATPELAFVATKGEIKSIPKEKLPDLPINLIIVNTFHLWQNLHRVGVRRGYTTIHNYANFQKTIMSDSGGFQVFSLGFGKAHHVGKVAKMFPGESLGDDLNNPLEITDKGVGFFWNEKKLTLTPEKSIQIQKKIGADIMFSFDECTSPLNSYEYAKKAMERTHKWLIRCMKENQKLKVKNHYEQALFAIVQGGYFKDLRKTSAKFCAKQDVPGFGIGGSLGRTKEDVWRVLEWTIPNLPDEKPRHLLGIGQVRDIFESVERGVDLFDCVIPTREARHKVLYTKLGKINVHKMRNVKEVCDKTCLCEMCANNVTIEQLSNFFSQKDPRAFYYATIHNIQFYSDLMKEIREAIASNKFFELKEKYFKYYP